MELDALRIAKGDIISLVALLESLCPEALPYLHLALCVSCQADLSIHDTTFKPPIRVLGMQAVTSLTCFLCQN